MNIYNEETGDYEDDESGPENDEWIHRAYYNQYPKKETEQWSL